MTINHLLAGVVLWLVLRRRLHVPIALMMQPRFIG